jgi:phosphoribosylaminoimidazolecarboxamide formyltransferase/IMP cyclohydrolase
MAMAQRALLSVYDKTGLATFGRGLVDLGWELISTGGTAKALADAGVPVMDIASVTEFPEILDGRVKTLHPAVFGGILGRRESAQHQAQMAAHAIGAIDLVAVNLYPFRATVARPDVTLQLAIENIDIGGPSMIRAAAKNHRDVLVLTDPADYEPVLSALRSGAVTDELRYRLACDAFAHTAAYDAAIAGWLGRRIGRTPADMPDQLVLYYEKAGQLSYGENPHQPAAFYRDPYTASGLLAGMRQLQGKPLSFNNLNDAQGAVAAVSEHSGPAAVAVKHATPCGVGTAATLAEACRKAHDADPVSIYGGIVAVNRIFDQAAAEVLRKVHLDVLIAPEFTPEALATLARKTALRVLALGAVPGPAYRAAGDHDLKRIGGGLLLQAPDYEQPGDDPAAWTVPTERKPSDRERSDLAFAWRVVKHVRSNAIVIAKDGMTLGIGGGQTNRVDSARIAAGQAGEHAAGAVLASDAYIPFRDSVDVAAAAGVTAIIQPGGSIRDEEAVQAANELGMSMVFTGVRHLRH